MACIYAAENRFNGKIYIGATAGSAAFRWRQHVNCAGRNDPKHMHKLHRAITKYGPKSFVVSILFESDSIGEVFDLEQVFIAFLDSVKNGYNVHSGGIGGNRSTFAVGGQTFESKTAAAMSFGICPKKMNRRLDLGHSPEQAVGLAPQPVWRTGEIIVEGVRFKSRNAAARAYGVSPQVVKDRINLLGWSLEEALGIAKRPKIFQKSKTVVIDGQDVILAVASRSIGYNSSAIGNLSRFMKVDFQTAFEILRARGKGRS